MAASTLGNARAGGFFAVERLQAATGGRGDYEIRKAGFQPIGAPEEDENEKRIKRDPDNVAAPHENGSKQEKAGDGEIHEERGDNHFVAELYPGEAFGAAVIFRDGLKRGYPPEVAVNLDVPVLPPGVGGLAPAFRFVE